MEVIIAFLYDIPYEDIKRMKKKFGVGGFALNLFDWEYCHDPESPSFENLGGGWGIVFSATKEWQGLLEAIKTYTTSFIIQCKEEDAQGLYEKIAFSAVPYFKKHYHLNDNEKEFIKNEIEKQGGNILQFPPYVYAR